MYIYKTPFGFLVCLLFHILKRISKILAPPLITGGLVGVSLKLSVKFYFFFLMLEEFQFV